MLILSRPSKDCDVCIIPVDDGIVCAIAKSSHTATAELATMHDALSRVTDALTIVRDWQATCNRVDIVHVDLDTRVLMVRRVSAHYTIFARRHNLKAIDCPKDLLH